LVEKLILYGTRGCHLCEQAEALCLACLNPEFFEIQLFDISVSDELIDSYGVRIPVLKRVRNEAELGWPFDASTVMEFLEEED
jgi:hypothetical protein